MKENQASRTAQSMAMFRALESARPPKERLFADEFAAMFLSPSMRLAARIAKKFSAARNRLIAWIDRRWPGGRASAVARTCFIDRTLRQALTEIRQVVILGAGYDSRAYRIEGIEDARVFEVDRRETQAMKRRVLMQRLCPFPPHVVFVETDFMKQTLAEVLASAGFDRDRKAFFIWEGVTNYLDEPAVDATLRFVGSNAPGSQIVFTYTHRGLLDGSGAFSVSPNVLRHLQRAGEPWTFGFYPAEVASYLRARGLELKQDLGAIEYGALCMGASKDEMKGYEFYHVAIAEVRGPEGTSCRR
ncbi:MAG: SAM-dependent methyltransferase [Candidatus Binatus sp.]|jgi:methyltransferase (TIGR00027 family)